MKTRIPIYVRVLGWLFLNLAIVAAGIYFLLRSSPALEWLIRQQAEPQLQSMARLMVSELAPRPREEWTGILEKYRAAYGMDCAVFGTGGQQLAGPPLALPRRVLGRLMEQQQPGPWQPPRPDGRRFNPGNPSGIPRDEPLQPSPGMPRPPMGQPQRADGPFGLLVERTAAPDAWWFILRVPLRQPQWPGGTSLVIHTGSLSGSGLLLNFATWLWGAGGILLLSALLWIPFVRGITCTATRMRQATDRIAAGQFDIQVPDARRDELGDLAAGINRMAHRLAGFVSGQKRFLGDIAHELCTPLARLQMAGAALEMRAPEDLKLRIADLTAEVEAMSALVSELLDFSRAGLAPQSLALTSTDLRPLIEAAASRENIAPEQITLAIPESLAALAHPGLLTRAAANVLRNSLRYAGPHCRITVSATVTSGEVLLTLADDGPGIPEEALPKIFDPFYRLESARDRESGGTGLGLAIVKTCLESCRGTVTAANLTTGGLAITFRLPATENTSRP